MGEPTDPNVTTGSGLTGCFSTCADRETYERILEARAARDNDFEGQRSGSAIQSQTQHPASTASTTESTRRETERRASSAAWTDIITQQIARLEAQVASLEDLFRARDGEDWREQLALRILDPDDIPERQPGEMMGAYRARLEQILIDRMLNPDGSIKDEYKNDPSLSDYALWAQTQHYLRQGRAYAAELEDPATTPERRAEIHEYFQERAVAEEIDLADRNVTQRSETHFAVRDAGDTSDDKTFDVDLHQAAKSDFLLNR